MMVRMFVDGVGFSVADGKKGDGGGGLRNSGEMVVGG
jgi:hypothetical protein